MLSQAIPIGQGLFPVAAANGDQVIVAYSNGSPQEVWAAHSTDGGKTYSAAVQVAVTGGTDAGSSPPAVAFTPDGTAAYLVHPDYASGTRCLWLAKFSGGVWQPSRQITFANSNAAAITITPDGVIHIIYHLVYTSPTDSQVVHIMSSDGGTTFSPAQPISGRGQYGDSACLAATAIGLVAYYCWGFNLYVAGYSNGSWSDPHQLAGGGVHCYWVKAVGSGATWQQSNGMAMYAKLGGGPNVVAQASSGAAYIYPAGAVTADGLAHIFAVHGSAAAGAVDEAEEPGSYGSLVLERFDEQAGGAFVPAGPVAEQGAGRSSYPGTACGTNMVVVEQRALTGQPWTILARWEAEGNPPPHQQFDDVPTTRWSYEAITTVVAAGIMSGETDTHFGATDPMTREQFAVVAARLLAHGH